MAATWQKMSLQSNATGTEPVENRQVDLGVDLAPHNKLHLKISNPVMIASGTFGYDGYGRGITTEMDLGRLGAVIPKTFTWRPKEGNPEPRWDPPSFRQGMEQGDFLFLNSIGLANPGIESGLADVAPKWSEYGTTVLLSISGDSVSQFAEMARMSQGVTGFQGIELNLSCPNVENGSMFSHSAQLTAAAVDAVRKNTELPVLAKLAPNVPDITEMARAAVASGADALTICNTIPGMAIDTENGRPVLGGITGGLSGHSLRPISLTLVYRTAQVVDVPIIGGGGVFDANHVVEFLMAGATAVQVGSANLVSLWSPFTIVDELRARLTTTGVNRIDQIRGVAQTG